MSRRYGSSSSWPPCCHRHICHTYCDRYRRCSLDSRRQAPQGCGRPSSVPSRTHAQARIGAQRGAWPPPAKGTSRLPNPASRKSAEQIARARPRAPFPGIDAQTDSVELANCPLHVSRNDILAGGGARATPCVRARSVSTDGRISPVPRPPIYISPARKNCKKAKHTRASRPPLPTGRLSSTPIRRMETRERLEGSSRNERASD